MEYLKIISKIKKRKEKEKIISDSTEGVNVYCARLGKQ